MVEYIEVDLFKTECLKTLDRLKRTRKKIIITEQNVPIAELVSIKKNTVFGKLKGTVHVKGDLIASVWDDA